MRRQHPDPVAAAHQGAREVADERAGAVVLPPRIGLGEEEDAEGAAIGRAPA